MRPVPVTRREFQRLADLWAGEALILSQNRKQQGAYYLAGYAVECALKACIAKQTKRNEFPLKPDYVRKVYSHDLKELLRLAGLEQQLQNDMKLNSVLAINWNVVLDWNEEKRYVISGLKGKDMHAALTGPKWSLNLDKATLVRSDLDIGVRVMAALSRARIPVTLCDWTYVPSLDEWQLVIATPWYVSKGPRETYTRVFAALKEADIYQDVPLLRISVRSPKDPLVKVLEREVKTEAEGVIHIVDYSSPGHVGRYSVLFAPFAGPGGAMPSRIVSGVEELRALLEQRLHIGKSSVDEALRELEYKRSASIFHVRLTNKEAKALGLA